MQHQDIEMGDARQEDRSHTLKGAIIMPGPGKAELRCLVTNISAEGAELTLEAGQRAPAQFVLHVPHEGMAYRAEVRWREEGRIGVLFHGAESRAKPGLKVVAG